MTKDKIRFKKFIIDESRYGKSIFDVYFIEENGRCKVLNEIYKLDDVVVGNIKSIISFMATVKSYSSSDLKWNLPGRPYGQISPAGHRVFFFRKCGDNLIFFGYHEKKKGSLKKRIYERFDREKARYEKEFKQFYRKLS